MTLYFDSKVQFLDSDTISTISQYHPTENIFAVASYSQDRGGSVTIFDDSGEPLRNISYPVNLVQQVTALCWHPENKFLIAGWENGEINAWMFGYREFVLISGPHKSPIILLVFSEKGGRLVSVDSAGVLTGWRCENSGQFLTMFTHDLRESLLSVTFKKSVEHSVNAELAILAKAAVAGDELALDTLTVWRPRTTARTLPQSHVTDNFCFYVGTQSGIVYFINQSGTCTEILQNTNIGIMQMLWHPKREAMVILMEDMTIGHYLVESNGVLTELSRVKLSSQNAKNRYIAWAGGSSLAIITGDFLVRIWDIDSGDNYLLVMNLPNESGSESSNSFAASSVNETFACIAYCVDNQTLCAGTNQGNLYTWRRTNYAAIDVPENAWQLNNISSIKGSIKQCTWGTTNTIKSCILANCVTNVYILKEHLLKSSYTRNIWVTQKSANQAIVEHASGPVSAVSSEISIAALCLSENNLVVTNGKNVFVYKLLLEDDDTDIVKKTLSIKSLNNFVIECLDIFLYDQTIITLDTDEVKILSLGGIILQTIGFTEIEGQPIGFDAPSKYLTIFTMNGYIKVFDISRHEPKLLAPTKCAYDMFENFGEIIQAKCNCDGTNVLLSIATKDLVPDGKIYIWNLEKSIVREHNFSEGYDVLQKIPITFYWEDEDPRLFVCETRNLQPQQKIDPYKDQQTTPAANQSTQLSNYFGTEVKIMFVEEENGEFIHNLETISLNHGEQLVEFCAPYVITLNVNQIIRTTMRDFKGMEQCDSSTRKMVLDFSLHVALGNMDHAFRCIRFLQSNAIWQNLAEMCISTGRLDVAKVCLGYLKKARSVRAVNKAMSDPNLEEDAQKAVLAIELGFIDVAERLYKSCGRYDLLNKMLQACGRYKEALEIAETFDRIHLKNAYFKYAEWLKINGDVENAIIYYEKSASPIHSITQLLMDDPGVLKQYIQNTDDINVLKWWGQYLESTGDMEGAFNTYEKANDYFSQMRILCFLGQISKAEGIAKTSDDRAACYFLARHFENIGKIKDSVQFYTRAKSYGNAVRICKENDMQDELWTVANSAQAREKASAAAFFEETNDYKRAVQLYYKAGKLHEAVEMAFNSQQSDILHVIAAEFNEKTDPELIKRCSEFFLNAEQPQKAVQLLASSRNIEEALQICIENGVPITDTLAETLTPTKEEFDQPTRNSILVKLGEILQQQGDYHTATKKFTQAGDKIRAIKSLLKSGDTDKIMFFASMSRQKEVYLMAANYLQSSNWQNNTKILKNIVTFYSKAQAFDLLANFYVTCAQVEIDEYRDYKKAFKAIQEAYKCLNKSSDMSSKIEKLQAIMVNVRSVIELQDLLENGELQTVIMGCRNILGHNEQPPSRHSDVLVILFKAFMDSKMYSEALGCFRELTAKVPDWIHKSLVEKATVEKLAQECGVDFDTLWRTNINQSKLDGVLRMTEDEEYFEEIEEEL